MYEYEYNTLGINKDKFEIISIVETLQQVDIFIVKKLITQLNATNKSLYRKE